MPHVFEHAASGRSKCRGCKQPIAKGELRFGERLPNPFGEGEVTHWFHPACAAYKRPDALIEGLGAAAIDVPDREALQAIARSTLEQHRLVRIDGAERSPPTSQAKCRHCKQPVEKRLAHPARLPRGGKLLAGRLHPPRVPASLFRARRHPRARAALQPRARRRGPPGAARSDGPKRYIKGEMNDFITSPWVFFFFFFLGARCLKMGDTWVHLRLCRLRARRCATTRRKDATRLPRDGAPDHHLPRAGRDVELVLRGRDRDGLE